jgi:hypothetical protein
MTGRVWCNKGYSLDGESGLEARDVYAKLNEKEIHDIPRVYEYMCKATSQQNAAQRISSPQIQPEW